MDVPVLLLLLFFVIVEEVVSLLNGVVKVRHRVNRISHIADDLLGFVEPERLVILVDKAQGVEHPWEEQSGGSALPVGLHGANDLNTTRHTEPFSVEGESCVAPELDYLGDVTWVRDPAPCESQGGQRMREETEVGSVEGDEPDGRLIEQLRVESLVRLICTVD